MKTTKNILSLMLVVVLAGVCSSCGDSFLQKNSLVAVSSGTFWQTEDDALEALAACYDGLQNYYLYNGDPYTFGPLNMDCMTDNGGHFNWSGWMAGYDICNGISTTDSWVASDYWKASYEVIKRCNKLLDNIDRIDMNANTIAIYKAEATVLRCLMYTNLTMTYQDVPYIVHEQSLTEAYCAKDTRSNIVSAVMADLKDAVNVLPTTPDGRGHITKGAALSLLGRIALYNEMWDEAISAYTQVLSLGYSLFSDYTTLFTEDNEACDEIVWAVRYEGPGVDEGSAFGAHWNTPLEAMNGTIDLADDYYCLDGTKYTDKYVCATDPASGGPDLWNVNTARYYDRDPRLATTLWLPGISVWGSNTDLYGGAAASLSTIYVMKYFHPEYTSNQWDEGQDFYIIRYAEVLLSLAEAYIEKGSNLSDAISLIDQVRTRAGMPTIEEVEKATSQADLREIVRHERRVELAFEGLRLFDLYRWRLLKDAVDRINAEAEYYNFAYEYRNYRGDMEYVWPIPLSEIESNLELEQHDLWK